MEGGKWLIVAKCAKVQRRYKRKTFRRQKLAMILRYTYKIPLPTISLMPLAVSQRGNPFK